MCRNAQAACGCAPVRASARPGVSRRGRSLPGVGVTPWQGVVESGVGALSSATTGTADALSVEGWRRGIVHRGAGRVRGASGPSPVSRGGQCPGQGALQAGRPGRVRPTGWATFARTHSTIDWVVAPGVKIFATPSCSSSGMSASGMMPPPKTTMSRASRSAEQLQHPPEQRHVRPGEHREADRVGVLLDGGLHDLLRGLVQAGVDDLHPGVPQGARDDLGAPVVAVQARLGDDDPDT